MLHYSPMLELLLVFFVLHFLPLDLSPLVVVFALSMEFTLQRSIKVVLPEDSRDICDWGSCTYRVNVL